MFIFVNPNHRNFSLFQIIIGMEGLTMKYVITEECGGCGSCASFCEQEGIEYLGRKYVINQEICTGYGTCLEYCPIDGAITEV
jgi:MinD superfamily P-loop ATPase